MCQYESRLMDCSFRWTAVLRGDVSEQHCYRCGETGFVVCSGVRREKCGFDGDDAGSGGVADYCRYHGVSGWSGPWGIFHSGVGKLTH
jgi:hypothetical protein